MIELHIAVSYGLNISTAARSISHRVKEDVYKRQAYALTPQSPCGDRPPNSGALGMA